jgi:hypothetical protein
MALSSVNPVIDNSRRTSITENLGTILLLGTYFHEIFRKVSSSGAPRRWRVVPRLASVKANALHWPHMDLRRMKLR